MKQLKTLFILVTFAMSLASCNNLSSGWMSSSSATNEVLVIMDSTEWKEPHGRALFDVLNSPVVGLPQNEANFKILHIDPRHFSNTFKMARNIVEVYVSTDYTQPKMSAEINKYASGQVVLKLQAPDKDALESYLKTNSDKIVSYLVNKELERIGQWLNKEEGTPKTRIRNTFGFELSYPKGLNNITEDEDFFWATNNSGEARQDVVIFSVPYTSQSIFEKDSLIAIRNRVLGKHIKGSFDSQMVTATSLTPLYRKLEIDGLFRAELRGLWEMTTDMMGGPFVMQAFVNENTNRVIFVDVFVYAPEKRKRNFIRNLEGAFYTIKISETDTEKEQ